MSSVPLPSESHATRPSVVIVVPRYASNLKDEEKRSLKHLHHFLGEYDKCYICPQSLTFEHADMAIVRFGDGFFQSITRYNRLMLSGNFYKTFEAWDYILIYQLDCLVFSDQLSQWCLRGYDYIGSPWFESEDEPEEGFKGVGNGGFSLRRVSAFLSVIQNSTSPKAVLANALRLTKRDDNRGVTNWIRWVKRLYRQPARFRSNEDVFWSRYAEQHFQNFTFPTVD